MKEIKVKGKVLRDENYLIKSAREKEVSTGMDIDAPSTLVNLIRLRKKLREPFLNSYGFSYVFPISLAPRLNTNGFRADFPLIFDNQ